MTIGSQHEKMQMNKIRFNLYIFFKHILKFFHYILYHNIDFQLNFQTSSPNVSSNELNYVIWRESRDFGLQTMSLLRLHLDMTWGKMQHEGFRGRLLLVHDLATTPSVLIRSC